MKYILFFLITLVGANNIKAQSDVIYTTDNSIIFNCKIIEVKYGNMVVYSRNLNDTTSSATTVIEAEKIIKNGIEMKLYPPKNNTKSAVNTHVQSEKNTLQKTNINKDYEFYERKYNRARKQRNFGAFLTFAGVGVAIGGLVLAADNSASNEDQSAGEVLFYVGDAASTVGLVLWISGGVMTSNNRKAMERAKTSVSIGATKDGFGLTMAF